MTDPRRILDDGSTHPFARSLLASASDDGLDRARLAELVRAAGKATTDRTSSEAVAASATPSRGRTLLTKAPLIATLSLLTVGAVVWSRAEEAPADSTTSTAAAAAPETEERPHEPAPPSVAPTSEALPVALLPSAPPAPSAPAGPSERAAAPRAVTAPASPVASDDANRLMAEVRALERVSAAIARGAVADARAHLVSYERTFPRQLLASEARFLEIEILVAEDRPDQARERARAYLASWPDSPYAARVQSIVPPSRP